MVSTNILNDSELVGRELQRLLDQMFQPAIPELQWGAKFLRKTDSSFRQLAEASYQEIRNVLLRLRDKKVIDVYEGLSGYKRRYKLKEPDFFLLRGSRLTPVLDARLQQDALWLRTEGFEFSIQLSEGPSWRNQINSFIVYVLHDEPFQRFYVVFDAKLVGVLRIVDGKVRVMLPGFVYGGEPEYARATRLFNEISPVKMLLAVEGEERITRVWHQD